MADQTRHETQPLAFAGALCLGSAVYLTMPFEPAAWVVLPLPLICILAWLVTRAELPRPANLVLTALTGLTLGVATALIHANTKPAISLPPAERPVMVEGWITAVEPGRNGARLRIQPHAISGTATERLPGEIRLTHRLSLNVSPGRFVRCYAHIRPPPGPAVPGDYDFRRQAFFDGLDGVGYVLGRCRGGTLGPPSNISQRMEVAIGAARRQLGLFTRSAAGERAGGFAAALVSGDRSHMDPADAEALRASGLAHLLAISGLHLGIVGGLVYVLVFRLCAVIEPLALRVPVQKIAASSALLACFVYLTLSGASVSTQRAFIMAMVAFGAILADRPALSLRGFTIAMVLVVLTQPASVLSAGFQMSFSATGALIVLYQNWMLGGAAGRDRSLVGRARFAIVSILATSVVASLATLPFALYHFDRAAPLGLLANCLAMPVVTFISAPAAALSMILAPFGLADWGLRAFGFSLELVLSIAHWTASIEIPALPNAPAMPGVSLLAFAGAIGATIAGPARWQWVAPAALILIGTLHWRAQIEPDLYWPASGDIYLRDAEQHAGYRRITFADGDGLGPLSFVDLEAEPPCERGCRLPLAAAGAVQLANQSDLSEVCWGTPPRIILALERLPLQPDCAPIIYWPDIASSGGGAIFLLPSGEVRIAHPPACGRRPWHPCLPDQGRFRPQS